MTLTQHFRNKISRALRYFVVYEKQWPLSRLGQRTADEVIKEQNIQAFHHLETMGSVRRLKRVEALENV